jgi:hypothetical protein
MPDSMKDTADAGDDPKRGPMSKVERTIRKYELEGLGEELEKRWLGDGREQESLRSLAAYFNERVLEQALIKAGTEPLQGEIENLYELLTDDDVSEGMRIQAKNTLSQDGVDAEDLLADFVSHQSIHTYLRNFRNVDREPTSDEEKVENSLESVQQLTSRLTKVTDNTVENLRTTGRLDIGNFDVITEVRITCEDCGRQYRPAKLFNRRSCECSPS